MKENSLEKRVNLLVALLYKSDMSAEDKLQMMRNADEIVNYKKEIKIMTKEFKNNKRY